MSNERVMSAFGRWLDDQYERVITNWNTPFLDYLKSNGIWDFRGKNHGGDGEFIPENMAEGFIPASRTKDRGTGPFR